MPDPFSLSKIFLIACAFSLFSNGVESKDRYNRIFNVNPALYNAGFTYLVFPFNSTFLKANKIRKISYEIAHNEEQERRVTHCFEFNKQGNIIKEYNVELHAGSPLADTGYYHEYIYNAITGLLDTSIDLDDRPRFTTVICYYYNQQNRLEKTLRFGFTEVYPWTKDKVRNESSVRGRPENPSAIDIRRKQNDFSSTIYRYYIEGKYSVEEQTTLYDFSKKYGGTDTCKGKRYYYSLNDKIIMKANKYDCTDNASPSEYYTYNNNGLLDSMIDDRSIDRTRDVIFRYDSQNNLTGLTNIWKGKKVSDLEMTYDKKGLLRTLKRTSLSSGAADYFMDNVLNFDYEFYK